MGQLGRRKSKARPRDEHGGIPFDDEQATRPTYPIANESKRFAKRTVVV
jgi:hypothetical protein